MYDVNVASEVLKAIAAFVALGIAVILVLAGPVAWVLLVVLGGALILIYGALREGPERASGHRIADQVNCPACGSRIPITEITCEYCGEEL